jgi:quinol-cytochrome oxidoreductase complex cytochrome b subunit
MSKHEAYVPKSRFAQWLEYRLPILSLLHSSFVVFPTPRNLNYTWTFGGILSFMLLAQILTGVALAMHYVPQSGLAFASIEHIMRDVNYGWLLRYLHANGASFFFFALYIHTFRGIYYGSYKAPREVLWLIGVAIFVLAIATGFLGYVLPWGQMSFWAATVITSLFTAIPVVGDTITTWLWGGYAVGDATLNRFFALHYLLPFVLAALVVLHIWALHVHGSNNPAGIEPKTSKDTLPFHPYFTIKDSLALICFIALYSYVVFYIPNYLYDSDNYIEANPLQTPVHIVPEWYYLPYYAILRSIPSKLIGTALMFVAVLIIAFLPWLDTCKVKSASYRPLSRIFFWLFVACVVLLGWCGAHPPEGGYILAARILTAYYFLHFLVILPLLARFEKTKPVPASIYDAVLAQKGASPGDVESVRASKGGP